MQIKHDDSWFGMMIDVRRVNRTLLLEIRKKYHSSVDGFRGCWYYHNYSVRVSHSSDSKLSQNGLTNVYCGLYPQQWFQPATHCEHFGICRPYRLAYNWNACVKAPSMQATTQVRVYSSHFLTLQWYSYSYNDISCFVKVVLRQHWIVSLIFVNLCNKNWGNNFKV